MSAAESFPFTSQGGGIFGGGLEQTEGVTGKEREIAEEKERNDKEKQRDQIAARNISNSAKLPRSIITA